MKTRSGYVFYDNTRGYWVARITWTDPAGKRRERRGKVENKTAGRALLKKWADEIEESQAEQLVDGSKMTFGQLAGRYETHKLTPPSFRGGRVVAGMKSWKTQQWFLKALIEHFGRKRIASIKHADLDHFREIRLNEPTIHGRERSLAHVHRELQLMRSILNYAVRNGWLRKNPFGTGPALINPSREEKRDRILTFDEEDRLLASCTGRRAHLRSMLICLIDTGLRKGEMRSLRWDDIDLNAGLISVRPEINKVGRGRLVGISSRLRDVLLFLRDARRLDQDHVFEQGNFKRAFWSACEEAGIEDLRIHDLRHTHISRLIQAGMPIAETMRLAGHSTLSAAFRYMNIDQETAKRAVESIDSLRERISSAESEFIN